MNNHRFYFSNGFHFLSILKIESVFKDILLNIDQK
jgi:hypothetical protein